MTEQNNDRQQVEQWLRRPLTSSEQEHAESIDAMTDEQLAVVATLRSRNLIVARTYIGLVVPAATNQEVVPFLGRVGDTVDRKLPAVSALRGRLAFESVLARPLEPAELGQVESVSDFAKAQLEVARELVATSEPLALFYLQSVARHIPMVELELIVKRLLSDI